MAIEAFENEQENIFIEQAEYIQEESFEKWSAVHPNEKQIIKKLVQFGAKVIIGPRGCGKTTLMLKSYYKHCNMTSEVLPIYVNFKLSLKMEPLYRINANASYWFNQWLYFKIYSGLIETLEKLLIIQNVDLLITKDDVIETINYLELGQIDRIHESNLLSITTLVNEINEYLSFTNKKHCVLLLDDAAHAFSSEQQKDFFDFFRQVKSRTISPKAAIYPGTTVYSSSFHVGHDAEEIDVWLKPDNAGYRKFMLSLLKNRLQADDFKTLANNQDLLTVMCYACFGIPRALLNMVREMYPETNEPISSYYNRSNVLNAAKMCLSQTRGIYASLQQKLPMYSKFIINGNEIFSYLVELLKEYNKGKDETKQAVTVAIRRPIPNELAKVLGFYQYAGLLMPKGELNKGEKGVFDLYIVHYAALIERNAFMSTPNVTAAKLAIALQERDAHAYKRVTPKGLMSMNRVNEDFSLALPNCPKCGAARALESAKFCLECGAQLKMASIFYDIINNDINVLPLTEWRIRSIKESSNIRTIKDILLDNGNVELRKVPRIGPFWAKKILSYAEEYLA